MRGYVIGNGTSRIGIALEDLRHRGFVAGCNALYREFHPDLLVSVDPRMAEEIRRAGPECPWVWANPTRKSPLESNFGWHGADPGWMSGPTAADVMVRLHPEIDEVFLIGVDLYGIDGKTNNVYAGTENYRGPGEWQGDWETQAGQWRELFEWYDGVLWVWRRPWPEAVLPPAWQYVGNLGLIDVGFSLG